MPRGLARVLTWGVPAIALLMLALTLTPAELWTPPVNDAVYKGFDPNLIYSSNGEGGLVKVSRDSIDITARSLSGPSVNLATTLMPNLNASMDVAILANEGAAQPVRVGAWSPWSTSGHFVVFGAGPENLITAETITKGDIGPTLAGGNVLDSTVLGHYKLGSSYTVAIFVDRSGGRITSRISGPDGVSGEASMSRQQSPEIFGAVQVSLSASALGGSGTSHAVITNYVLTVPHERWWASIVADPRAKAIQIVLALAGILLLGLTIATAFRNGWFSRFGTTTRSIPGVLRSRIRTSRRIVIWTLVAIGIYLIGNALLFPLGGHPFDMAYEKLYAYVARTYGPAELYSLLNTQSLAGIWAGTPYVETSFPYGAVVAYLFTGIGGLSSLLAGGGGFRPDSVSVEYMIKAVNVLFGLADAALIYGILRQTRVARRWSLISAGIFLFNPAVWFSMSVWGQTHVISLFFVLAAVLLAEKRLPLWAWLALTAACLTRPQMIVFGLLVGLVFLRKFTWRENVIALSWTVILTFLALLPLTLATSPSLPVDVTLNNFRIQEAGGNGSALSPVSQGGYSIWPLVTYLTHGASGLARTFTPSSDTLVGSLTYQRLAQILTVGAVLLVSALLLRRRRAAFESGDYLPLVALGFASFLMFITGVVATHFLLALPFLLLCRRWMNNVAYIYVNAIWTVTTFVPMYGEMGAVLSSKDYPLLAPGNNPITAYFVGLYSWDRFITVAVVANICAVIWLALLTIRQTASSAGSPGPPAGVGITAAPEAAHGWAWFRTLQAWLAGSSRDRTRVSDIRYPAVPGTLAAASALVVAGVLYLTRYKNFYMDEWDFITGERSWNLSVILMAHNEHWTTIPVLIWKLLFIVVGIRSHIPYQAVLLAFHVATVLLLFTLIRRRSGDLPAFAAAITLLVLGSGGTNIVWAFQISFVGSVAFGLLAMLLVDGEARFRGQLLAASAALLCSLMCSGIGLGFLAAVAAELAADPPRRRRLLALVVPVVAYAAWFLAFSSGIPGSPGMTCPGCGPPAVGMDLGQVSVGAAYFVGVASFVAFGLVASVGAVFGASGAGAGATLLPVVGALIALRWYRQRRVESWQIGMVAGFAVLFTLIGLVRTRFGTTGGADPHYVYVGAVFLLPLVADAVGGLPWRASWGYPLIAIFALTLFANTVQLRDLAISQTDLMRTQQAELQTLEVFRGAPDMALEISPDSAIMPQLTASRYFPATDELGSPVPRATIETLRRLSPGPVDQVMRNLFGEALTLKADRQRSVEGLSCQSVDSTVASGMQLLVPDGQAVMLESNQGGSALLFLGFLEAPTVPPVQRVQILPATQEWLHLPDTGQPVVWQLQIKTSPMGMIRVCSPAGVQVSQTA